jgi:hypothetical protein
LNAPGGGLQLNGNAPISATRTDGSNMVGGNVVAGEEAQFIYNGTNFTSWVPPIPQQPPQTTFYVRPDGNDNNDGFANTAAHAFLTISGAMAMISSRYISQNTITLRVADGLYVDAFAATTGYISSWNIIGNAANPGNVVVNATSTNQGAYPPHAGIARACQAAGPGNITIQGFTFQSYFDNLAAVAGGNITVTGCNFTAPTSGAAAVIFSTGGHVTLYGNCQYTGSSPVGTIFVTADCGTMTFGYYDALFTNNLVFNISASSQVTSTTITAYRSGSGRVHNPACAFTGYQPTCQQYNCSTGGGISFSTGVNTIFPGTQPGVVTSPGWTQ